MADDIETDRATKKHYEEPHVCVDGDIVRFALGLQQRAVVAVKLDRELPQLRCFGYPFHLNPVMAPVTELRICQSLLNTTVISEQQQAFTVGIQSACGINLGNIDEIRQAAPATSRFRSELTQYPEWFVKQDRLVLLSSI